MIQNPFKGSMLNPSRIGQPDDKGKQIAKPFAKIQAKIGQKYVLKGNQTVTKQQDKMEERKTESKNISKINKKYEIWSE